MKLACVMTAMLLLISATARGEDDSEAARYLKKAYPPAEKGMTRFAILLPKQDVEENFKVELIVGKKIMVDSVNRAFLGGSIEEVNIEGWGFSRYVVKEIGPAAQTLIGGGVPQERFVTMQPLLIRYNSRLPVAVYVPEGAQVKYRIWSAPPEAKEMPKVAHVDAADQAAADAQTFLADWLRALDAGDRALHRQCLHSVMRQVNEYGTAEAMAFWTK